MRHRMRVPHPVVAPTVMNIDPMPAAQPTLITTPAAPIPGTFNVGGGVVGEGLAALSAGNRPVKATNGKRGPKRKEKVQVETTGGGISKETQPNAAAGRRGNNNNNKSAVKGSLEDDNPAAPSRYQR